MKVLLFVQTGDGRPRCVGRFSGEWRSDWSQPLHHFTYKAEDAAKRADRWWLVECENAEAGRFMIGWLPNGKTPWPLPVGRILASGGRA